MLDRDTNGLAVIHHDIQKIHFIEGYFNDSKNFSCIFGKQKQDKNSNTTYSKSDIINKLYENYVKLIVLDGSWLPNLKKNLTNLQDNYTMTRSKLIDIINITTHRAKYLGFTEKEIIELIKSKFKDWKNMLTERSLDKDVFDNIEFIKYARKNTLAVLDQIKNEDIKKCVSLCLEQQQANNESKQDNNETM